MRCRKDGKGVSLKEGANTVVHFRKPYKDVPVGSTHGAAQKRLWERTCVGSTFDAVSLVKCITLRETFPGRASLCQALTIP